MHYERLMKVSMNSSLLMEPDRNDYRLSRKLFSRLWLVAKPFWVDKESRKARLALTAVLALTALQTYLFYQETKYIESTTNAVVGKAESSYFALIPITVGILLAIVVTSVVSGYLRGRIVAWWRGWLTAVLADQYLANRMYYRLTLDESIDNPDQRIQQEVAPFVTALSQTPVTLLSQLLMLATGGSLVASVSSELLWIVVIYAAIDIGITVVIYTPLIRLNYESTIAEADLRRGLLHIRENAEPIALYDGEPQERLQIQHRLDNAVFRQWRIDRYSSLTGGAMSLLSSAWKIVPLLVLAPLLFRGNIEYGAIAMAATASTVMLQSFSAFSYLIPQLADMAPHAIRVAHIIEKNTELCDQTGTENSYPALERITAASISLENINLETPSGDRKLTQNIHLTVDDSHTSLLITGTTGTGKSSLMRAIAGLWDRGSGTMKLPPSATCMFLPQKPYMPMADLRSQLLYPKAASNVSDETILDALDRVTLTDLASRHGGLDAVCEWGKVLSLGEQQRIAFARVILSNAEYILLDEATSALDNATEETMYKLLQKEGFKYISVGHRNSLFDYHNQRLHLNSDGSATLTTLPTNINDRPASRRYRGGTV